MDIDRLKQVIRFGWIDAKDVVSQNHLSGFHTLFVYFDIIRCFFLYRMKSIQYIQNNFYSLSFQDKSKKGKILLSSNLIRDKWYKDYFDNKRFFYKYSSLKYDLNITKQEERNKAYRLRYGLGVGSWIHNNVHIYKEHFSQEDFLCPNKLLLSNNVEIDFTGGVIIKKNVRILEGVKILTHGHDTAHEFPEERYIKGSNNAYKTPLVIEDNVLISSRATIMPGVACIGRNSIISPETLVRFKVPPYSIVMGNPAKIVGFVMNPENAFENEKNYPEGERYSLEFLEKNYQKYFVKRIKDIKQFVSL